MNNARSMCTSVITLLFFCLCALPAKAAQVPLGKYAFQGVNVSGELVLSEAAGHGFSLSIQTQNGQNASCAFLGICTEEAGGLLCRDMRAVQADQYILLDQISESVLEVKSTYPQGMLCGKGCALDGRYALQADDVLKSDVREELAPQYNACMDKAATTAAMLECLDAAYRFWDGTLNANYQAAKQDCASKEVQDRLLKAQRAWVKYKELMQEYILQSGDGSLKHVESVHFAVQATKSQARALASE